MRVLFFSSDNDITSGAFLSMAILNKELREKYKVETLIVLPCKGDGETILWRNGIDFMRINTYSGITSIHPRIFFKIWKKENINHDIYVIKNYLGIIYNQRQIRKIINLIRHFKPDIIHINTTYHYLSAKAALKEGIPYIWHIREFVDENYDSRYLLKKSRYKLMKQADSLIVVSEYAQKKYTNDFNKLIMIYNGVDSSRFYNEKKRIFQHSIVRILNVGTFGKWKGKHTVIDALDKLYSYTREFEMHFVGRGNASIIEEKISRCSASSNIFLDGHTTEPETFYDESDIFIMSSKAEAFGRVTVEAMMSGCLVIASDTGANPEIIGNDEYGILYKYGDADDLYQKIVYALDHKEEMSIIADRARKMAVDQFSSINNTKRVYELYRNIFRN